MDEDAVAVVEGLERALSDSGLTQADFAAALGTSAPRFSAYRAGKTMPSAAFFVRAQRLASGLTAARDRGWMTPQSTAKAISRAARSGDDLWALKMALQARDQLRELLRTDDPAVVAWSAAPRSTGDRRWDALLAALARHEFERAGRESLRWAARSSLRLGADEEWTLRSLLLDDDEVRAATPVWLAEYGVYAAERDLVTA
jgi:transcriptional regulator with XRE-family HTH domain